VAGADIADSARAALPQGEHHQVLRMGQPERLQRRPVEGDDAARGGGEGEADLAVEGERVHDLQLSEYTIN